MKANTITGVDTRPTMALSFLVLVALTPLSGAADTRGCAMTKPPAYMGTHPGPMRHPSHRGMRHGSGHCVYVKGAPTDIAIVKQAGSFATLLKYHLVAERVSAADVLTKRTLDTASGQELPTSDLSVVRADIRAGNGIIHVVDKVLLPSG